MIPNFGACIVSLFVLKVINLFGSYLLQRDIISASKMTQFETPNTAKENPVHEVIGT